MRLRNTFLWLPFFIATLFLPMIVWANTLTILDVVVPQQETPAGEADVQVYFNLRSENGMPVTDIKPENCQIKIDSITPEVKKAKIKAFKDGDKGVAVVFIFPNSKNYSEEAFGIRSSLTTLSMLFNRPIDMLNAIPYDYHAQPTGWTKASEGKMISILEHMKTTEDVEVNLFTALRPSITALSELENIDQKYIVLISDAEGALVSDRERVVPLIGAFSNELIKNNITPIIIGYSPDGREAMPNVDLLKRIANMANGIYFQAEDLVTFQKILNADVHDYIFTQYIYQATIDMSGKNYLEKGKYSLQFNVESGPGNREKAAIKIDWPKLLDDLNIIFKHLPIFIALVIGLIIGVGASFLVDNKKKDRYKK